MPSGKGGVKTKGRSLDGMSAFKKRIITVKAALNCLGYVILVALARVNGDPTYQSYRDGYLLNKTVEDLLENSGVSLTNGGEFQELRQFQEHLSDHKIIVFDGLNLDRVIFSGNSLSTKKLYLIYDRDNMHYDVIKYLKCAMTKNYTCNVCVSLYYKTRKM